MYFDKYPDYPSGRYYAEFSLIGRTSPLSRIPHRSILRYSGNVTIIGNTPSEVPQNIRENLIIIGNTPKYLKIFGKTSSLSGISPPKYLEIFRKTSLSGIPPRNAKYSGEPHHYLEYFPKIPQKNSGEHEEKLKRLNHLDLNHPICV